MNYLEWTKERKSIRSFKDQPVSECNKEAVKCHFRECERLVADIKTELLVVCEHTEEYFKDSVGYQGKSFDAPCYLILLSEVKTAYMENAGYISESILLKVISMGMDSCWLTVNDGEAIRKAKQLDTDMQVVSVIAMGYGIKEKSLLRSHIKTPSDVEFTEREGHVAPKIALSELLYEGKWGEKADLSVNRIDSSLRNAFLAASFAPSFLNRQSYRFILDGGTVVLVKIMDSLTGEADAKLNCGAVMYNFAIVLSQYRPLEIHWIVEQPKKAYVLPTNCEAVGYCHI